MSKGIDEGNAERLADASLKIKMGKHYDPRMKEKDTFIPGIAKDIKDDHHAKMAPVLTDIKSSDHHAGPPHAHAAAHVDDVGHWAVLIVKEHLVDDFTGCQVALYAIFAGGAEGAADWAANL